MFYQLVYISGGLPESFASRRSGLCMVALLLFPCRGRADLSVAFGLVRR